MNAISPDSRRSRLTFVLVAAFALTTLLATASNAQITLVKLSTDTFTNSSSQHATEVEPDTFSFGNTIVTAFRWGASSAAAPPTSALPPPLTAA